MDPADLARGYFHPGVIMLGHANHPTVTRLFPQIAEILRNRGLHPVTLDEMFGTSRSTGRSTLAKSGESASVYDVQVGSGAG